MSITASQVLCSTTLFVPKANGLHLRPAALLMKEACRFDADVWIEYADKKANAKSLMNIVMLCVAQGDEITVLAEGYDAPDAIQAIETLFSQLQEEEEEASPTETTPRTGSSGAALVSQFSQQVRQVSRHIRDIRKKAVGALHTRHPANDTVTKSDERWKEDMTTESKTVKAPKRATEKSEKKVHFELAAPTGSEVFVAGDFNNWDPTGYPLHDNPNEGLFAASISLPRGRHEYKFIVDGRWCSDPKCSASVPNTCGSLNSVIDV